jgi:hypothetical protein
MQQKGFPASFRLEGVSIIAITHSDVLKKYLLWQIANPLQTHQQQLVAVAHLRIEIKATCPAQKRKHLLWTEKERKM